MNVATRIAPVLALATLAGTLDAKTLVVAKNGPFPTIQSAIDAADSGDKVLIKPGIYFERPAIIGKNDFELRGTGAVIIDGRGLGSLGDGPAVSIEAHDVVLRGLTIRNARAAQNVPNSIGAGVSCVGDALALKQVRIENCTRAAVIKGNYLRVDDCKITNGRIDVDGDDARIDDSSFTNCDNSAIDIQGNYGRVTDCVIDTVTDGAAVLVDGDEVIVRDVTIRNVESEGIEVLGSKATIQRCKLKGIGAHAINVHGALAVIEKARVEHAESGILVFGANAEVARCRIEEIFDGQGISLMGAPNSKIVDNQVRSVTGSGISLENASDGSQIVGNVVQRCANESYGGIRAFSANLLIANNTTKDNARSGLSVGGDGCIVDGLIATRNGQDGLEVELGTGIRVENVLATKNLRHGVANFAPGLELRNSVLTANRVDLANTGTIATLSNVTFESGSVNFAVELD